MYNYVVYINTHLLSIILRKYVLDLYIKYLYINYIKYLYIIYIISKCVCVYIYIYTHTHVF